MPPIKCEIMKDEQLQALLVLVTLQIHRKLQVESYFVMISPFRSTCSSECSHKVVVLQHRKHGDRFVSVICIQFACEAEYA